MRSLLLLPQSRQMYTTSEQLTEDKRSLDPTGVFGEGGRAGRAGRAGNFPFAHSLAQQSGAKPTLPLQKRRKRKLPSRPIPCVPPTLSRSTKGRGKVRSAYLDYKLAYPVYVLAAASGPGALRAAPHCPTSVALARSSARSARNRSHSLRWPLRPLRPRPRMMMPAAARASSASKRTVAQAARSACCTAAAPAEGARASRTWRA